MGTDYLGQVRDKDRNARAALASVIAEDAWTSPVKSAPSHFRNKAKLVASGRPGAVDLGILDPHHRGVDLQDCGLYERPIGDSLPTLSEFVNDLRLLPYDVRKARGELKNLQVTASPTRELMVRFVVRSDHQTARIRQTLPQLLAALPHLRVVSLNYLPEHVARLEGEREEVLTATRALPMDLDIVTLYVGPRSFFQTNTPVAKNLYRQARDWIATTQPERVLDLYCGVGGFGLFAATLPTPPTVTGVEVSQDAAAHANTGWQTLRAAGGARGRATFVAGDARAAVVDAETVIVNPPRRGIGPELAASLEASGATTLVYSSCNPTSLAADLAALPSFTVDRARLFDMFPQTAHSEVLVHATR